MPISRSSSHETRSVFLRKPRHQLSSQTDLQRLSDDAPLRRLHPVPHRRARRVVLLRSPEEGQLRRLQHRPQQAALGLQELERLVHAHPEARRQAGRPQPQGHRAQFGLLPRRVPRGQQGRQPHLQRAGTQPLLAQGQLLQPPRHAGLSAAAARGLGRAALRRGHCLSGVSGPVVLPQMARPYLGDDHKVLST